MLYCMLENIIYDIYIWNTVTFETMINGDVKTETELLNHFERSPQFKRYLGNVQQKVKDQLSASKRQGKRPAESALQRDEERNSKRYT